jgi:hypothetical protein
MLYVPSSEVLDSAHRALLLVMGVIVLIFAAMIVLEDRCGASATPPSGTRTAR